MPIDCQVEEYDDAGEVAATYVQTTTGGLEGVRVDIIVRLNRPLAVKPAL
jgi:hypothetical protein